MSMEDIILMRYYPEYRALTELQDEVIMNQDLMTAYASTFIADIEKITPGISDDALMLVLCAIFKKLYPLNTIMLNNDNALCIVVDDNIVQLDLSTE